MVLPPHLRDMQRQLQLCVVQAVWLLELFQAQ